METENILYSEVCKHRQFVLSFSSFSTHSFFFNFILFSHYLLLSAGPLIYRTLQHSHGGGG